MQIVWEQQSTVSAEPYCQPRAVVEGPGARLLGVRGELALKAVVRGKEGLRLQQCGHRRPAQAPVQQVRRAPGQRQVGVDGAGAHGPALRQRLRQVALQHRPHPPAQKLPQPRLRAPRTPPTHSGGKRYPPKGSDAAPVEEA
eukprot:756216-Prorocentrum_minimum.AAC.2